MNMKELRDTIRNMLKEEDKSKYRTGAMMSLRDIGNKLGVSHVAISKTIDSAYRKLAAQFLLDMLTDKTITKEQYDAMSTADSISNIIKRPEFHEYVRDTLEKL